MADAPGMAIDRRNDERVAEPRRGGRDIASPPRDLPVTVIEPLRGFAVLQLGELFSRFDLVLLLAWRDVKARYKQTALGWMWGVLQPLLTVAVLTVVFGHIARLPSNGVPYALFAFAGYLPWQFFASATNRSAASMTANGHLLKKVYVPRLAIPLAAVLSAVVDALFAAAMLEALMIGCGAAPGARLLAAPLFLVVAALFAWAIGAVLAAVNCRFRDVGQVLPIALQLWMYLTPVIYPLDAVPPPLRTLMLLNPATGVVTGFRWCICQTPLDGLVVAVMLVELCLLLVLAGLAFSRLESGVVDYL